MARFARVIFVHVSCNSCFVPNLLVGMCIANFTSHSVNIAFYVDGPLYIYQRAYTVWSKILVGENFDEWAYGKF